MTFQRWWLLFIHGILATFAGAQAPTLVSLSSNRTVVEGASLTLSVSANGATPLSFQWRRNGVVIPSATSNNLALNPVRSSDDGRYTVTISNAAGTLEAGPILIAVEPAVAPTVSVWQPSITVVAGESFSISTSTGGSDPRTYVWKKDGVVLPEDQGAGLYRSNATKSHAGTYRLTVTNFAGSATSPAVVVNVSDPLAPAFETPPGNMVGQVGSSLWLNYSVRGTQPILHELLRGGVVVNTSSDRIYLSNIQNDAFGSYVIRLSNAVGQVTSGTFTISPSPAVPPRLFSSDRDERLIVGQNLSWTANIYDGTEPFTYQWYKNGQPIAGATDRTLAISAVTPADTGNYRLIVSNAAGSAESGVMNLAVRTSAAPIIVGHPVSAVYREGSYVYLYVHASGDALQYRWERNGTPVPNATSSQLAVSSSLTASQVGQYRAIVSNAAGSVVSLPAVVELAPVVAPVIHRHPASQNLPPRASLELVVQTNDWGSAKYAWKKDGVLLPQFTSSSMYVSSVASTDSGSYTVTVSNAAGSVTSEAAVVDVQPTSVPPVILRHPETRRLMPDESTQLSVQVDEEESVSYQWYRDDEPIEGANSGYLYTWSGTAEGTYRVAVTNSAGTTLSNPAEVKVETYSNRSLITRASGDLLVNPGESLDFSIDTWKEPSSIRWTLNGQLVPGFTSRYVYTTASDASVGEYQAQVTIDGKTEKSRIIVVALREPTAPRIVRHPASLGVERGENAFFHVSARGQERQYQWRKGAANVPLAQAESLSIQNVEPADAGAYSVRVSNAQGAVTSRAAELKVLSARAPVILTHPQSIMILPDSWSTSLNVHAEGTGSLSYEWYRNNAKMNYNGSSLYLSSGGDVAGTYHVVVSNAAGSATSKSATVQVGTGAQGPRFEMHPASSSTLQGGSVTLTAKAIGRGAVSYTWLRNDEVVPGATSATLNLSNVGLAAAGTYVARAMDADGTAVSRSAVVEVQAAQPPLITAQPQDTSGSVGSFVQLYVTASGAPSPSYQWFRNGVPLSGETGSTLMLSLASGSGGSYHVVATNLAGSVQSRTASVSVIGPRSGVYFGDIFNSSGSVVGQWGLRVLDQEGEFVGILFEQNLAIVGDVTVTGAGAFLRAPLPDSETPLPSTRDRYFPGAVSGQIDETGELTGDLDELDLTLVGQRVGAAVTPSGVAQLFTAVPVYSADGHVRALGSEEGSFIVVVVEAEAVSGGRGTLNGNRQFSVDQRGARITGSLDPVLGTLGGTLERSGRPEVALQAPAAGPGPERLINLSIRAGAGSGARTLIVGYVIGGTENKQVLLRAAGPVLSTYQVPGVLADPRLRLYQKEHLLTENDDWDAEGNGALIVPAAQAAGAFAFPDGSRDAALLEQLAPALYSAHVTGRDGTTGVALVEIYDDRRQVTESRLLNVSARSEVGRDADIMIVGFVVEGSAPKRFLVRGVGPALADYNVQGVLDNPRLRLFRGQTVVRENDNWSAAGDAAEVAEVSQSVGAFPLKPDGQDSALLVYLLPGNYSAQLSGVNDTTGVGLVEVYEVP